MPPSNSSVSSGVSLMSSSNSGTFLALPIKCQASVLMMSGPGELMTISSTGPPMPRSSWGYGTL